MQISLQNTDACMADNGSYQKKNY